MAEKKTDRRALKTKKAICEGLAELLVDKDIHKITVQELSDKADIHRVTFYKHYMDIYDVYEQMEKEILSEIGMLITEYGQKPPAEFYPAFFRYIAENPKIFKMIFSPHNTGVLYQKLLKMFEGLTGMIWSERFGITKSDRTAACAIRYHSNGCLAIIADWVMNDFDLPKEFIVGTLSALDENTEKIMLSLQK